MMRSVPRVLLPLSINSPILYSPLFSEFASAFQARTTKKRRSLPGLRYLIGSALRTSTLQLRKPLLPVISWAGLAVDPNSDQELWAPEAFWLILGPSKIALVSIEQLRSEKLFAHSLQPCVKSLRPSTSNSLRRAVIWAKCVLQSPCVFHGEANYRQ